MRAIILFLALLGTALAGQRTTSRIVGGTETTVNQYPYMANMQFGLFGLAFGQECGGSLITNIAVLSAAHCYEGDPPTWWRVVLGTSVRSGADGQVFNINRITMHAGYTRATLDNDVAIVHLATAAVYSNTIQAARIAGTNYNLADGTPANAIGWGHTSYQGFFSEQLRHVTVNLINQDLCIERYRYLQTRPGYANWPDVTPRMLCAGILNEGGRDACQGDSGGPVSYFDSHGHVQIGITSWGFECADSYFPGVTARISALSPWIVANA